VISYRSSRAMIWFSWSVICRILS